MKHFDFLIIGQGLAGSLLAWVLHRQGFTIRIARDPEYSGASRVAAGMINPITGLRLALAENISQQLDAAFSLYDQIEKFFSSPVFYPRKIARLFRNTREQDCYIKRSAQARFNDYLGKAFEPGSQEFPVRHELGGFYIRQGGYLDVTKCLDLLDQYFSNNHLTIDRAVDHRQLEINTSMVQWQNLQAKRVIFCEGARMLQNQWFNWLPMQALHGDILTLSGPSIHSETILNFGHWLLPLSGSTYRYGATNHPDHTDPSPVPASHSQLLSTLNDKTPDSPFTCVSHQAGVRPATRDRMPFIGIHPEYSQLAVFNGFGSKGSLMIPYYLAQFVQLLTRHKKLDPECDIYRYQKHYRHG